VFFSVLISRMQAQVKFGNTTTDASDPTCRHSIHVMLHDVLDHFSEQELMSTLHPLLLIEHVIV